jgi:hypothetical protein
MPTAKFEGRAAREACDPPLVAIWFLCRRDRKTSAIICLARDDAN